MPTAASRPRRTPARPLLGEDRIGEALARLAKARALQTLVRGALPLPVLQRLLKDALPRRAAREMPVEFWSSMAAGIALETPVFGVPVGQALHDQLAWDREPGDMDAWWQAVRERPLEALWMAALSPTRAVRKEFAHIAEHCLENFRASPACSPPSWEFVDGLLAVQSQTAREMRELERDLEDAERRGEADRQRLEELRADLRQLRRENSELRSEKAQAERRAESLASRAQPAGAGTSDAARIDELERRLRKAEKEREHLLRERDRRRGSDEAAGSSTRPDETVPDSTSPPDVPEAWLQAEIAAASAASALDQDPNARRRVLRQLLRKLVSKGKIGASHTHEDNVYRGVADHEKGLAKQAIDLLYREGFLIPKPTVADPHVSLSPERLGEIQAILDGQIENPRLLRFVAES